MKREVASEFLVKSHINFFPKKKNSMENSKSKKYYRIKINLLQKKKKKHELFDVTIIGKFLILHKCSLFALLCYWMFKNKIFRVENYQSEKKINLLQIKKYKFFSKKSKSFKIFLICCWLWMLTDIKIEKYKTKKKINFKKPKGNSNFCLKHWLILVG